MKLWDKINELREETIKSEQTLEIQLLINNVRITDYLNDFEFITFFFIDILELESSKYIIEDKTIETEEIKSEYRFIQVHLKKEVFE